MKVVQAQGILRRLGYPLKADGSMGPITRDAIKSFQRGWAYWRVPLRASGRLTRRTKKALAVSAHHQREGRGSASPHFSYVEWKSKGNGWISVDRDLIRGLEKYRDIAGATSIVSGFRDPEYNASLPGAATNSQHIYGNASDIVGKIHWTRVAALRQFSGIGYYASNGLVRHVDVRHKGPNTSGGSPERPTTWTY